MGEIENLALSTPLELHGDENFSRSIPATFSPFKVKMASFTEQ
jgi:hypothetical protein